MITKAIDELSIELVLTAHPTEIARRTLIHKLIEVNSCLAQLDHDDLVDYERNNIMRRLRQLIAQCWHTDEIRKNRPTPIDEAKWGLRLLKTHYGKVFLLFYVNLMNSLKRVWRLICLLTRI